MSYNVDEAANRCLSLIDINYYEEAIGLANEMVKNAPTSSKAHLCQVMALYCSGVVDGSVIVRRDENDMFQYMEHDAVCKREIPLAEEELAKFVVDEYNRQVNDLKASYFSAFYRSLKAFLKLASHEELEDFRPFYRKMREDVKKAYMSNDYYGQYGEKELDRNRKDSEKSGCSGVLGILFAIAFAIGALYCGHNFFVCTNSEQQLYSVLGFFGLGFVGIFTFIAGIVKLTAPKASKKFVRGYESSIRYFDSLFPEL